MSEDKLVPCIRFKGFVGEWENRSFKDIVTINSGKDYKHLSKGDIPVYGTGGLMLYVNDKLSEKDAIGIGRKGTIDRPQFLKAPFWTVDTLFFMVPKKKFNIYFVYCLSEKTNWKKYDESTGLPSLSKSTISKISSFTPPLKEQQKIGGLFSKLDRLLDLQQQKLDQLELLKKALLQKLFPKQGTEIPELRFKGFEDEWKTNALQEISKIVGGGTPDTNKAEYWNGDINWYSPTEIGKKPFAYSSNKKISKIGLKKSSAKLLPANKTVLFTSRAGIGDMAILKTPAATNQGFQSLELKDNVYPYFVYSYGFEIKRKAKKLASGSTFLEISNKEMKRITLEFPNVKEQQKIGTFFAKVDRLIELENKKFSNLKLVKKILLQNMFVE